MFKKAKSLAATTTLINKRPTKPPQINQTKSKRVTESLPNGPSCSRWFSCSCCHQVLSRRTFFSSNSGQEAALLPPKLSSLSQEEEQRLEAYAEPPQSKPTPHLPLPPSLPYSPNSYPFRRHLSILSLSLLSSNSDESWDVFAALHSSLHKYVPDETFKALLVQQVSLSDQEQGWRRVRELLLLGEKCGVLTEDYGGKILESVLDLGMRESLRSDPNRNDIELLRSLWKALTTLIPCLDDIPLETRQNWLKLQIALLKARGVSEGNSKRLTKRTPMEETVLDLVERGGTSGLADEIGQILFLSRGTSVEGLKEAIRLMAWCLSRGAKVQMYFVSKAMDRIITRWNKEQKDGVALLRQEIEKVLEDLEASSGSVIDLRIRRAVDIAEGQVFSRMGKVPNALAFAHQAEHEHIHYPELVSKAIDFAQKAEMASKNGQGYEAIANMKAALRFSGAAFRHHDEDHFHIITSITSTLRMLRKLHPHPLVINALSIPYIRQIHVFAPDLPSSAVIDSFELILSAMPDDEAYILARQLYEFARSADPHFTWSQDEGLDNRHLWSILFNHALSQPTPHLHFASRLYADRMADGLLIPQSDSLTMITAIGLKPSLSRPILLERHIKDHMWNQYDDQSSFVSALVQGLTKSGIKDASLALKLAERLYMDQPLDPVVIQMILAQLAKSSDPTHRQQCLALLHRLPTDCGEIATWSYNTVLSYLVSSGRPHPSREEMGRKEMLKEVLSLYKDMVQRGIKPDGRTVGTVLRALTDNDMVDVALAIFHSSIDQGYLVKSHAVGRLMVRLALYNREEEAEKVEARWRSLTTKSEARGRTSKTYDLGVVGARVLMDVKRGREVDYEGIRQTYGWVGTAAFLEFLETLKPASRQNSEVVEVGKEG